MRAFAAVFRREVFERRFTFAVALAAGFVPLVGSALYGWLSRDAAEGRVLIALVGATALSAAFAILLGGSIIVGETREKRISFYFSRPISSVAMWGGKLLAAILVTLATALLAFAPGWLSAPRHARSLWGFDATPGNTVLAALVLAVVLVLGSHAVVTVVRLRSPWVVLDLLLAPALVLLAVAFLNSLVRNSGSESFDVASPAKAAVVALAAALFLGLLVASLLQVAEGRTDARRAHGAFSVVFLGVSGLAVSLVGGYAGWCASATAIDLQQVWGGGRAAPHGGWVFAGGPLQRARGAGWFLFDAAGRRSLRLHDYAVVFSQNGTRAAWGEPRFGFFERKDNRSDLVVADLATGRAAATGLETLGWNPLALSPSGRKLAVRDSRTIDAYDVSDPASPRQLAAFSLAEDRRAIAFVDEDTIRLFPGVFNRLREVAPTDVEIAELSLHSKKSLVTGRFDRETLPFLRMGADGHFLVGVKDRRLTLHDGRTGALLATLAVDLRMPQARFLTGNRIAVAGIAGAKGQMKIFLEGEEGQPPTSTRTIDLGPAARIELGGEMAPGRVAVSLLPFEENLPASRRAAKLVAVDASTGAVSPLAEGLLPANRMGGWLTSVLPPAEAGAPWSTLFLDPDGRLVRLDPATGAQTVLLGKGK